MIRSLKKEIINELNIWQNTNAENCQLKIDIHHFQEKLKELNILCINCETSNAEIEHRKKRYSEQLTKISKLISEQNFDAANWAIILDEMAFANRELFEILLSTATVERRALQLETAEEDKYRNTSERLNLRRIELRQELYSQMNNYESLREQINQTESNLTNLQKAIDVYDAEYWQLNDAEHNLQSQIFQLQELLRHSRRHRRFNSTSESSSPLTDTADKNESEEYKSDECLITKRKFNTTIPHRNISKKGNFDITNAKSKCQVLPKTTPDTKRKQVADETSDSSSNIRSDFMWKKKETDSKLNQPVSPTSSKSQYQKQIQQKDSNWSSSMESFKTTPSQTMTTETQPKRQKSRIDLKKRGKISGGMNKGTVNEIGDNQESITDFQSSEENKIIDSSKSSNFLISDDETTDLTSESISLSDALPSKTNIISPISSITKDQLSSLSDNSSGQETKFRQPSHISESENSSEISTNTNDLSQQQQQRQQLMRQPSYNQSLNQVKSNERQSRSLSLLNHNVELWEEISERAFFRDIDNKT
ncbi:T-cell receptor beta chain ANA 11, putative [Brugia malayi]|uniref:Bm12786 n=1 Tax=Brugia malayi TaxID=6279 RepID=A0A0K0IVS5_BRUMA|nr:T-cell receptor beta chain ANA 11, putative [Brugia malayi]CRZ26428.1 Bm12786 [Brugia malayi]VIO95203.1 T-cell receptor beta chain ANA 11, putative [Brugia malayi]